MRTVSQIACARRHRPHVNMLLFNPLCTYFLMMCVLTVFTMYKEDNTIMVALEKDEAGVVSHNHDCYQGPIGREGM